MSGFFFAFLAVALASIGARDQITLARLVNRNGPNTALLVLACLCACAASAFAAWAGSTIAPGMTPNARSFLAALALGWAGAESLLLTPGRKPEEPTRSLGAASVVLLAHQLTDAARFLIFALAVAFNAPPAAGLGGATASVAMLATAFALPEYCEWQTLRWPRRAVGMVLVAAALWLGLGAMGMR